MQLPFLGPAHPQGQPVDALDDHLLAIAQPVLLIATRIRLRAPERAVDEHLRLRAAARTHHADVALRAPLCRCAVVSAAGAGSAASRAAWPSSRAASAHSATTSTTAAPAPPATRSSTIPPTAARPATIAINPPVDMCASASRSTKAATISAVPSAAIAAIRGCLYALHFDRRGSRPSRHRTIPLLRVRRTTRPLAHAGSVDRRVRSAAGRGCPPACGMVQSLT